MSKRKILLNSSVGLLSQFITLILGFVVPRIVMKNYGSDTNGLVSTITQIFTYIALLESGINQSAKNMLYKPLSDNDEKGISFWMSIAQRYYRRISWIYLLCVCAMGLFLPFILKTNVSFLTVFTYIIFEGLTAVISFYYINTWTCFLQARGDGYVISIIELITKIFSYSIRIVLVLYGMNIALIQIGYFCVSLLKLLLYRLYIRKKFSWVNLNIAPSTTKLPDRNSYILTEITWTIFSSTDMIVLGVFLSTVYSSVYSTYNMVFVALTSLLSSVYNSLTYNLGLVFNEDKRKYISLHDAFDSLFLGTMSILMSTTYIMILPFIRLYTKGITDVEYVNHILPLLFCLIQMMSWTRYTSGQLSGIAGYAKITSRFSLLEAICNLVLSVIFVKYWGISGVLLATVISLPIKVVFLIVLANKTIMKRSCWKSLRIYFVNYILFLGAIIVEKIFVFDVQNYIDFIGYAVLSFAFFSICGIVLNFVANKDVFTIVKNIKGGKRNAKCQIK